MNFKDNFKDIDQKYKYDGSLGVELGEDLTSFAVWAPEAENVELRLYSKCWDEPLECLPLQLSDGGVWLLSYPKRLEGLYYRYAFTYSGVISECVDIYAKAVGPNGEFGYICDLKTTNPENWDLNGYVRLDSPTDAIIYELSVRDFSSDLSSNIPENKRGKFTAFTETDSKLPSGIPTCLGHIKRMGFTHVHLLPIFDFYGVDELSPEGSYNWGYNPENYNAPDGWFSENPSDPVKRITELKQLVQALHNAGIGVIMDVVYNHTYKTETSCFNITYPKYYHRFVGNIPSNGSGCGNEIASEREMVRKYIIDSVLYWAEEYKIDGFRFDLMAILDVDTLNELSVRLKKLNPSAILYGEGWAGGHTALSYEISAYKDNAALTPDYAYFNDSYRDAIKGDTFKESALGYISGNYHYRRSIINGLTAATDWGSGPEQVVNYCEAHDNLTLWDKLILSAGCCHDEDRKKMSRLAMALILLAQGIPFIHAGQEFLRSKPLPGGGFDHNSYRSSDTVNSLKWYKLDENLREVEYMRGLIKLRKSNSIFRLRTREEIDSVVEVMGSPDGTIALRLNTDDNFIILINPIPRAKMFILPDGEWLVYVSDIKASSEPMATYCEGVVVPPISVMVLKLKV